MSLVKVNPGLKKWLMTDEAMVLTRQNINHCDCFVTTTVLSESRLYTMELIRGLLSHQTPELMETFEEMEKDLKTACKAETEVNSTIRRVQSTAPTAQQQQQLSTLGANSGSQHDLIEVTHALSAQT
eukprot:4832025-Amphidinium_carterae.2